ncbi:hypothetical protein MPR_2068 [Myroides profundi]|nr:hypothetical protein MPR_2068 [Myroides profundi]
MWSPIEYNFHHNYNMGLYDMGDNYMLRLSDGSEISIP